MKSEEAERVADDTFAGNAELVASGVEDERVEGADFSRPTVSADSADPPTHIYLPAGRRSPRRRPTPPQTQSTGVGGESAEVGGGAQLAPAGKDNQAQGETEHCPCKGQAVKSRVEKRTFVELVPTNARGWPMGTANPAARWTDETVARARELHAGGLSAWKVAKALGVANRTVRAWLDGTRRPPPARHVARLRVVTDPETDPQSVEPQANTVFSDASDIV